MIDEKDEKDKTEKANTEAVRQKAYEDFDKYYLNILTRMEEAMKRKRICTWKGEYLQ
jgi:hypothetical protein